MVVDLVKVRRSLGKGPSYVLLKNVLMRDFPGHLPQGKLNLNFLPGFNKSKLENEE